ncbi:MAG: hypothetical protein WD533_04930 [Dehalococcoidia bacterium]
MAVLFLTRHAAISLIAFVVCFFGAIATGVAAGRLAPGGPRFTERPVIGRGIGAGVLYTLVLLTIFSIGGIIFLFLLSQRGD